MRLVDADALQAHFDDMQHYEPCACNFEHNGNNATQWYCVEDAVENAPAVDAIPVEWLKKVRKGDNLTIDDVETIDWLISWWHKEQEAR